MSDSQPFDVPPVPPSLPPVPPPAPPGIARPGPPWEQPGPAVHRFIETAKGVLLDPHALFSTMRREGGLQMPLVYAVIGATFDALVSAAYRLMLAGAATDLGGAIPAWAAPAGSFSLIGTVIVTPIVAGIVTFIVAGIYHVLLVLLDGARFPFETTFRVTAYVIGSTALLGVIPICGSIVGAVWGLVSAIFGLARAQEIPAGKAAVAVLVPTLACCFLALMLIAVLGLSALALIGAARG